MSGVESSATHQTLIIEVSVPPASLLLFQSLLEAESGLGVLRCFDSDGKRQQIWSTPNNADDLHAWLDGLLPLIQVQRLGEWLR